MRALEEQSRHNRIVGEQSACPTDNNIGSKLSHSGKTSVQASPMLDLEADGDMTAFVVERREHFAAKRIQRHWRLHWQRANSTNPAVTSGNMS